MARQVAQNRPEATPAGETGQVLRFRRRGDESTGRVSPAQPAEARSEPDDDFARYEQDNEEIDYRQRRLMNVIAIAITAILLGAGVWIADTIGGLEKDQDCVLQGRVNCAPIEVPIPGQP